MCIFRVQCVLFRLKCQHFEKERAGQKQRQAPPVNQKKAIDSLSLML